MMTKIIVPKLGFGTSQAKVVKWNVAVGDKVKKFEPLVQLETEKAVVEIEALVSGVIQELTVAEGTTVSEGTMLGCIEDSSLQGDVSEISFQTPRFIGSFIKLGILLSLLLVGLTILIILLRG
jgi:pyruvate/2-oxoglutarate dehydrogenase complex dihydrolipoamide acyltransferase (E2) component